MRYLNKYSLQRSPRKLSTIVQGLGVFAACVVSTTLFAAGTTGDFGKDLGLNTTLHHFQVDKQKYVGQRFEFNCPAVSVRDRLASIYGTDDYPANSAICVAALHAGAIDREGGMVLVQLNPGQSAYPGSERFQIETATLDGGTKLSIAFVTPGSEARLDAIQEEWKPRLKWDDKFSQTGLANIRLTGQRFAFKCPGAPAKLAGRRVYGTDSYPIKWLCLPECGPRGTDRHLRWCGVGADGSCLTGKICGFDPLWY